MFITAYMYIIARSDHYLIFNYFPVKFVIMSLHKHEEEFSSITQYTIFTRHSEVSNMINVSIFSIKKNRAFQNLINYLSKYDVFRNWFPKTCSIKKQTFSTIHTYYNMSADSRLGFIMCTLKSRTINIIKINVCH